MAAEACRCRDRAPRQDWLVTSEVALTSDALSLIRQLEDAGALTPTRLKLPAETTYDQYEAIGVMISRLYNTNKWLLADWLAFGELAFPNKYEQAALLTGLTEQSCMNKASIARRVPPSVRNPNLDFSHHEEVRALEPDEQRRWLSEAEEKRWSKMELRAQIQGRNGSVEIESVCKCCGKPL